MVTSARTWPAVLLAPVLALADQSVAYALVPWSCSHQSMGWLHAVHATFLVATLATLVAPWSRLAPGAPPTSSDEQVERRNFFALVGVLVAVFSALVIVAMWIPQWLIPACAS
jgi:hypothetical protein